MKNPLSLKPRGPIATPYIVQINTDRLSGDPFASRNRAQLHPTLYCAQLLYYPQAKLAFVCPERGKPIQLCFAKVVRHTLQVTCFRHSLKVSKVVSYVGVRWGRKMNHQARGLYAAAFLSRLRLLVIYAFISHLREGFLEELILGCLLLASQPLHRST